MPTTHKRDAAETKIRCAINREQIRITNGPFHKCYQAPTKMCDFWGSYREPCWRATLILLNSKRHGTVVKEEEIVMAAFALFIPLWRLQRRNGWGSSPSYIFMTTKWRFSISSLDFKMVIAHPLQISSRMHPADMLTWAFVCIVWRADGLVTLGVRCIPACWEGGKMSFCVSEFQPLSGLQIS